MAEGFKIPEESRERISADMKAKYRGPEGPRLREIDHENGLKARGWNKRR
ncbi:hypothetical protein [Thermoplasma volcanium]|nr:hypothetical protein [Thermoplasma volcanium]